MKKKIGNNVSHKEMLEDLSYAVGTPEDLNNMLQMLNLNEDEAMIFKRASLHIRRTNPDHLIIKKAYEILISKSFHNTYIDSNEGQGILAKEEVSEGTSLGQLLNEHSPKIIMGIFILLIGKMIFFAD